jgi:Protein of unknown function (DUF2605)
MIPSQPPSQPSEQSLLKTILQPLLADFAHWFDRSIQLLEAEHIGFLSRSEQSNLLTQVKNAQQEVRAAQMLFQATDGQVGIEPSTMLTWHKLVGECWQVSARFRNTPPTDRQFQQP